jgi:signal peptidase I
MSATSDSTSKSLPWGTVWLSPRLAVDRVIAAQSRLSILILALVAGSAHVVAQLVLSMSMGALRDWRIILGGVLLGVVVGMITLYVWAPLLGWSARLFGGRAPISSVRAALAWGAVPDAIGLSISLIVIGLLGFAGAIDESALVLALEVLAAIFSIWVLVATIAMFAHVEGFGIARALACVLVLPLAVFVLQLAIRTFLFQPFSIPSGTMQPTLLVGDHLLASKYAYGYSQYSLPFSSVPFTARKFASDPERGDVVVFRSPKDDSVTYIKRVVGLPGDRIQMINGELHVNEKVVARERIEDFVIVENGRTIRFKRWRETLPNGVRYETLDLVDNAFYDNTPVYQVPSGHIFVMGDNRDNSTDSRALSQVGYVPIDNLTGRAAMIYYSGDETVIRSERIGMMVR